MSKLNDFLLQFGTDKFMHFVVGGLVMGITSSWIVVGVVGIGKELYDYKSYGNFSKADAIVTILGGGFAFVAKHIWELLPCTII
jgi:hypothetical protein